MKRPTALKAIRAKCINCSGFQPKEVKECPVKSCALWPFRMGRGYDEPLKPGVSGTAEDNTTQVSDLEKELIET